ncbi:MAG: YceD family protein [Sulfuricella sp.]
MSEQAVVDNLEFARHGAVLQGELVIAELDRLQEHLRSNQGVLKYTLSGKTGKKGESLLECSVDGKLVLQCQRCLEALEYPIHVVSTLKVVKGLTQFDDIGDEDEAVDSIPASTAMNVSAMIEEEILLNLPISPLHAPGACREQDGAKSAKDERTNPFGALAALKGTL